LPTLALTKELSVAVSAVRFSVVFSETPTCEGIHAKCTNKMLGVPLLIQSVDTTSRDRLPAARAERTSLLMVMNFAVRFSAKFEKSAATETLLAILTHKMLRMPLLTNSIHAFAFDRLIATCATSSKNGMEATLTIGSCITLEKGSTLERLQALGADEMMHMPFFPNSSNTSVQYWLIAMSTPCAKELLVTPLAIRKPVLFVEICSTQRVLAISANEMFRVKRLAKCLNDLTQNRFAASSAGTTRGWRITIDIAHLAGQV